MTTRSNYADLQIRILEKTADGYPVELTLDWMQELQRGVMDAAILPWTPSLDPAADGEKLYQRLIVDTGLDKAWAEARGRRPNRRIRLRIDDAAPELHILPWEQLRDPGDASTLPIFVAADDATPFSRFLVGRWPPGRPIVQRPIRILVVMANPDGLAARNLNPVDVATEWGSLQEALNGLEVELTMFPPQEPGAAGRPCTLAGLEMALRTGHYHALHFIGHGVYNREDAQAALYMADEQNQVTRVLDTDFAEMLGRLFSETEASDDDRLRLIFLSACQSATRSPADAFRGLAPLLVATGAPAVVAMQDAVPVDTARAFAKAFYTYLLQYGQADRAANAARATLLSAGVSGAAIPVLFMRLADGKLLGQRGEILGDRSSSFWTALLTKISVGKCVPFLGPGVTERLLPTSVELAQQLAREFDYPFPTTQSLTRVAQFVGSIDEDALRTRLLQMMIQGFLSRMELKLDTPAVATSLSNVIREAKWLDRSRERLEGEIHQQLAELGLPLYVTTNVDGFMAQALEAAPRPQGHSVRRLSLDWRGEPSGDPERPHWDVDPPPSRDDPVVYHLFGTDEDMSTMVLTEDDYLDYLSRISRDHEYLLPTSVQDALSQYTLLFLGYRLEDLDLKVILRGLLPRLNLSQFRVLRVAAQIESDIVDDAKIEEVTAFFQRYFTESKIDIYWGTTQQFVNDLHAQWQEQNHG